MKVECQPTRDSGACVDFIPAGRPVSCLQIKLNIHYLEGDNGKINVFAKQYTCITIVLYREMFLVLSILKVRRNLLISGVCIKLCLCTLSFCRVTGMNDCEFIRVVTKGDEECFLLTKLKNGGHEGFDLTLCHDGNVWNGSGISKCQQTMAIFLWKFSPFIVQNSVFFTKYQILKFFIYIR